MSALKHINHEIKVMLDRKISRQLITVVIISVISSHRYLCINLFLSIQTRVEEILVACILIIPRNPKIITIVLCIKSSHLSGYLFRIFFLISKHVFLTRDITSNSALLSNSR